MCEVKDNLEGLLKIKRELEKHKLEEEEISTKLCHLKQRFNQIGSKGWVIILNNPSESLMSHPMIRLQVTKIHLIK